MLCQKAVFDAPKLLPVGKREIYAIPTAYTEPVTVLRLHRDGKAQLFINALVLLSLGFALAAGASNVAAPSPAQHYTTVPYPSCGFEFSATVYKAAVDSATADRQTYGPGDTITISGSVELQAYTYSYDSCSCYPGYWSQIDPSTASVYLELFVNSKWTSASNSLHPDSSGHFSLTYQVPGDQPVGTLNFRVTASPARISYGGCSPLFTPDDALGLKTVQVSIQSIPLSATLIVTPLSGQAPFTPSTWSGSHSGGQGPFTQVIDWGDGASDDVSNCGQNCPVHTYPNPGTYTITFKVTDSNGKTASDSKTITVYGTSSTSTSSPGVTLIPAIENVCNPAITIFMMIFAIIVTIIIIRILRRWILGLFPRAALILAIILSIMIAAALILVIGNVCTPALTVVAVIIILVFIMIIFRGRILGPPWLPPPLPPPPGGNVTGNATLTGPNGAQTQLTGGNLNQVGPGTTVQTTGGSFVRVPTPQGSNSQSVIGQDSRVSWLDPNFLTQIPWLRFPGLSQIYNAGSVLLRL
ncbi:MAG: PKD domain-containing protein, partial [Candidatus Bathyarchaeia archaeon]